MPKKTSLLPPKLQIVEEQKQKATSDNSINRYIADVYKDFSEIYAMWNRGLPILGGRTPLEFWNDSVRDYAVLAAEFDDPNDPVESYQSTISRDKTNATYAQLASKFFYPSVVAENSESSIDRTLGKVGDSALYWAYKQDGWPAESGQQKSNRLIHKCVVEGTAYTLDLVDENGLDSQLLPNEEVFYPNLWQPNIQLQRVVIRARLDATVAEAEEEFGDNPNWKDVDTTSGWTSLFQTQYPELKGIFDGIVQADKMAILHIWRRATRKELQKLIKEGKVNENAKRAWFYNVIVNNVAMFPKDNVCPYKSGFLPISKMIFEPMGKGEFALGNSVPNKCMEDKRWKDAWKTNLRWRGKLAGMPPQLVIGGHLNGEEVMLPSVFTSLPKDVEVKEVPGIQPITDTDLQLMQMTDEEINRSTLEPTPKGEMPARTAMIQQSQAEIMIEPFSQQLAFFAASRSFHILTALFQFLPKSKLKKICVPDQKLDDGLTGTFEIIFRDPEDILHTELDEDQVQEQMDQIKGAGFNVAEKDLRRLMLSYKLRNAGRQSRQNGHPIDTVFVSPEYIEDIKWYLFADAADGLQDKDAMAQAKFKEDLPLMLQSPYLVPQEVWREYVRMRGYNERLLQKDVPQASPIAGMPQGGAQMPGQPGSIPQGNGVLGNPPSTPNQVASAAAVATGFKPLGRLNGV